MLKINTTSKYAELKFDDKSDLYPLNEISYTVENESETVSFYNRFYNKIVTEQIANIQVNDVPVTRDNIQDLLSVLFAGYEGSGGSVDLSNYYTKPEANTLLDNKVDKVDGKQLSTEDYTTEEKTKLESLHNYDDTIVKADIASNTEAIEAEVTRAKTAEKVNADAISALDTAYKAADTTLDTKIDAEVTRATNAESELNTKIDTKVDKVDGKQLSTEDYTTAEKEKLASLSNYDDTTVKGDIAANTAAIEAEVERATAAETALDTKIDTKVDKVEGKQLSTEDYTTEEKTKLTSLENYDDSELRTLIETKADKDKYEKRSFSESPFPDSSIISLIGNIKYNYVDLSETTASKINIVPFFYNSSQINEVHLFLKHDASKTYAFNNTIIWKEKPTEMVDGATYEFIFTNSKLQKDEILAGYIKYE